MTPELARNKSLWRDLFALGAMSDASRFLVQIEEAIQSKTPHIKWPLWIAFIVTYSKPFTSNDDIGQISTKAIPSELKELHNTFAKTRDVLYGHSDPLETLEDGFQANQIFLRKSGSLCHITPHTLVPHDDEVHRAKQLVDILIRDLNERTEAGVRYLMSQIEGKPDGDYLFQYPNLANRRAKIWIK